MIILLELWVCKIGLLKTKEVSVLLSIVLFFFMLRFVWFVFFVCCLVVLFWVWNG